MMEQIFIAMAGVTMVATAGTGWMFIHVAFSYMRKEKWRQDLVSAVRWLGISGCLAVVTSLIYFHV